MNSMPGVHTLPLLFVWMMVCAVALMTVPSAAARTPVREILELVHDHALRQPAPGALVAGLGDPALSQSKGLQTFLRTFDPYAAHIPRRELEELKELQKGFAYGIGMDITQDQSRRIRCLPYAGGPAARCGITYGDVLLEVDGYDTVEADIADVAVLVRGEIETTVRLVVRKLREGPGARLRTFLAKRDALTPPLVHLEKNTAAEACIRIYGFSPSVVRRLQQTIALIQKKRPQRLIIDLRGNTGGDMESALRCASIFVHKGTLIALERSRHATTPRYAEQTGVAANMPQIIIRQDGLTASAAELFIAALSAAGRAHTEGTVSAGKAMVQEVFKLSNGDMLKLTTKELLFPGRNTSWQGRGLLPDKDPAWGNTLFFMSRTKGRSQ